MQYKYLVGIHNKRSCTVRASDIDESRIKVIKEMDRRHLKSGTEPPVGYDLELIETYDLCENFDYS